MKVRLLLFVLFSMSSLASISQNQIDWVSAGTQPGKNVSLASWEKDDREIFFTVNTLDHLQITFVNDQEFLVNLVLHHSELEFQFGAVPIFNFSYRRGDKIGLSIDNDKWMVKVDDEIVYTKVVEDSRLPSSLMVTSPKSVIVPEILKIQQ